MVVNICLAGLQYNDLVPIKKLGNISSVANSDECLFTTRVGTPNRCVLKYTSRLLDNGFKLLMDARGQLFDFG